MNIVVITHICFLICVYLYPISKTISWIDVIIAIAMIITAVATAAAAVAAFCAARTSTKAAKAAERSVTQQMESHNLTVLREFILDQYLERGFKATKAPRIKFRKVTSLRAAKSKAKIQYENKKETWNNESKWSKGPSYTWQNKVAFETAWALEHVGIAAFTGVLPLHYLLGIASDVIIDDWLLCRSWVESYRKSEHSEHPISKAKTEDTAPVPYHRRHAEWLALVTVVWMKREPWSYRYCDDVAELYGGMREIRSKIQTLSNVDRRLIGTRVPNDIKELIYLARS